MKQTTMIYTRKGKRMKLSDFSKIWMDKYARHYLEKSTCSRYEVIIREIIIPAIGNLKLCNIKPYQVEDFFVSLTEDGVRTDRKPGGYSYGTICKIKTVLSSMMTTAVQWELIKMNPCHHVKIPGHIDRTRLRCYTAEQARRFLKYVDEQCDRKKPLQFQYQILFNIALFGGLRRGEILGLKWSQIDFRRNCIHVVCSVNWIHGELIEKPPKTNGSIRTVSLPATVMKLLNEYQNLQDEYRSQLGDEWNGNNWLFIQKDGSLMSIGSPYNKFHNMLKKYNRTATLKNQLPVLPFHSLRHTNASLLVHSNEVDTKTVSRKLGHSNPATTMKYYVHSYEETEQKTAKILEDMLLN